MVQQGPMTGDDESEKLAKPALSAPAAVLIRWAGIAYRLGIAIALLPLLLTAAYVAFAAEPLWQRLMTLVVVGIIPAVAAVLAGIILCGALAGASKVIDPVIAVLWRLVLPLMRAGHAGGRSCASFAVRTMPRGTKRIVSATVACWRAWEGLIWAIYQGVRTVVQACAAAANCVGRAVARCVPRIGRAAVRVGVMVVRCIRASAFGLATAFHAVVSALDAIGCAINAVVAAIFRGATFPVRLVARILLRLSRPTAPRAAYARASRRGR
jgi:hypothetical protein